MHVGLDFDNTIAGYDAVFASVARHQGLIHNPAVHSKLAIRESIRALEDGEQKWMALQGQVYGKFMKNAELILGVENFLTACRKQGVRVHIVSHKTEYGHFDPDRVNLRDAAKQWMEDNNFFNADGYALNRDDVIFESTREDKVARIAEIGCSHFVDDLEEVFLEPGFPSDVTGILFDPTSTIHRVHNATVKNSWHEIQDFILAA